VARVCEEDEGVVRDKIRKRLLVLKGYGLAGDNSINSYKKLKISIKISRYMQTFFKPNITKIAFFIVFFGVILSLPIYMNCALPNCPLPCESLCMFDVNFFSIWQYNPQILVVIVEFFLFGFLSYILSCFVIMIWKKRMKN